MVDVDVVDYSKVEKTLDKLPSHIAEKFYRWADIINRYGWLAIKNDASRYKDHALRGNRRGQRASRLDRSYRVIYEVVDSKEIRIIKVERVTKRDYRKR